MNLLTTISRKVLVLTSLILATAALLLVPLIGSASDPRQAAEPLESNTLLLTPNRASLAVCVQSAEDSGVSSEVARATIAATMSVVAQHRNWSAAGLGNAAPIIERYCPGTPFLLQPGAKMAGAKVVEGVIPRVESASPYRVFIFILTEVQIASIFGNSSSRVAAQELMCKGQHCAEVTTGLYLSPTELRDPDLLTSHLERAIGLEPRVVPQQTSTER